MEKKSRSRRSFEIRGIRPDGARELGFGEGTPEEIAKYHRERLKNNPGSIFIARMVDRKKKA